ncbi:hypothetical protein F6X40_36380 [Paraburkholderia sp. UCT31]|uniref:hypothetical protein n=1 Tax=Paraburkholderia sp. UCT31 TaxID=2615209 RepID=UPI0016557579|nr:hypothetical protein [Paraburkholderia sp. UCT31]MBC8742019.1 hypothetical protein [Paraburkholderia sp. UCT31]
MKTTNVIKAFDGWVFLSSFVILFFMGFIPAWNVATATVPNKAALVQISGSPAVIHDRASHQLGLRTDAGIVRLQCRPWSFAKPCLPLVWPDDATATALVSWPLKGHAESTAGYCQVRSCKAIAYEISIVGGPSLTYQQSVNSLTAAKQVNSVWLIANLVLFFFINGLGLVLKRRKCKTTWMAPLHLTIFMSLFLPYCYATK